MKLRLRLREIATEKGYSMTRLHTKSEVSYVTIRKMFNNPYAEVNTATIDRLARVLGVSPSELFEDVPDDRED